MSVIGSFAVRAIYNRFSQCLPIQNLSAGMGYLRLGKHFLCDPNSSSSASLIKKIMRKVGGVALLAAGLTELYYGGRALIETPPSYLQQVLFFGQKPNKRYRESLHRNTAPEVLYLLADPNVDHNGAFPKINDYGELLPTNFLSDMFLSDMQWAKREKLRTTIIQHPLEICDEIQHVVKSGGLVEDLIIGAHGSLGAMGLSMSSRFHVFDTLPANCFDGLSSTARIYLESCSTGKNSLWHPNLAEWVSWISGKQVAAPTQNSHDSIYDVNPNDGRLDIRFTRISSAGYYRNITQYFNTSTAYKEKALFFIKMVSPTVFGSMTTWQMMRFAATVLQISGITTQWIIDKSAASIKRLSKRIGLYNPYAAKALYATTKGICQILTTTGKTVHLGMDRIIQPVSSLGHFVFKKSVIAVTKGACQILKATGKAVLLPVSSLGSFVFKKSVAAVTKASQNLFSKFLRIKY